MVNSKLKDFEAIALLTIISINGIILSSSQVIVSMCSSSSLINILYVTLLALLITFIICKLSKPFLGNNLLDISEYLGGKPLKFVVGITFIAYFVLRTSIFLKKISNCLQIVYYPMTNIIFIVALFCITAGIAAAIKNNSIPKSAVLIFPILLISIILIFIGNSKNFNYENIYPILGNGLDATFLSGLSNTFAFCGIGYMLFLPPKLKSPEKITKISLIAIIISAIFLVFSCANTLFLFGENFNNSELLPLYISVRYIEFGTFFQRLDAIFLFLCILEFICVFSLNTYLAIDILKSITSVSETKPLIFPFILIVFGFSLCFKMNSTLKFLEITVSKIVFITIAIIVPFLILVASNIKKKISE